MAASGPDQLRAIAARARELADGGLRREAVKATRRAATPLPAAVKAAARRQLPQRGGLAARVAGERVSVSVITTGAGAGVRLRQAHHDAYSTDVGFVRHPVPNTNIWVTQAIPAAEGWWTKTLTDAAPAATAAIAAQLTAILETIGAA